LDDWAMIQTWRQRSEDLRREAETRRLARAMRKGNPRSYRWIPVLWWELSRYGGRLLKPYGRRRASL
jgi:hypothetical protein